MTFMLIHIWSSCKKRCPFPKIVLLVPKKGTSFWDIPEHKCVVQTHVYIYKKETHTHTYIYIYVYLQIYSLLPAVSRNSLPTWPQNLPRPLHLSVLGHFGWNRSRNQLSMLYLQNCQMRCPLHVPKYHFTEHKRYLQFELQPDWC